MTIVSASVDLITTVLPNHLFQMDIPFGQSMYLQMYLPTPMRSNFTALASAYSGSAYMYVGCSYDPWPDPSHYMWTSTAIVGTPGRVYVSASDPNCHNAPAMFFTILAKDSASVVYLYGEAS